LLLFTKSYEKQKAMPQDRYQTVKDVADRLKVAGAPLRHGIKPGQLRAIDIGKAGAVPMPI